MRHPQVELEAPPEGVFVGERLPKQGRFNFWAKEGIILQEHGACCTQDGTMHTQPRGMHGQIDMAANRACGMHVMSDSAMHETHAGVCTCGDGTRHAELASKPGGIADQHSGGAL